MLIDTHAHVNFNAFKDDSLEVLKKSLEQGVQVVNVGSQLSTSIRAVELAQQFEIGIWAVVGVHPLHLREQTLSYQDREELETVEIKTRGEEPNYQKYLELARDKKTVAIGEVGLDYHHFETGDDIPALIAKQKEVFTNFIDLANQVDKPLMIHCWDAYSDLLEILRNNPANKAGIVHSFVGGYKTAKKFIELGFMIGLNGIITYSDSYDRLLKEIPLEHIVIETDCPYLAPVPLKGERNEPILVKYVAEKIASITGKSLEEVAEITSKNAKTILNLAKIA